MNSTTSASTTSSPPPVIRRKLWCRLQIHFIFRGTVLLILQPCTWNICVDDTSNVSINSDIILLLPYYQTKNIQLTPLWSLRLFQQKELWVVPDNNSAQKQWVEYRARIWWIRTVSKTINWNISELWAYSNGNKCGFLLMIIPRKNRGWNIGWYLVGR